ncbi:MAG: magnesium transporter [Myxococcota bacterium]|jgi:magnesium transporter|nr:magnesium transporter [Myxococcota bacterium]
MAQHRISAEELAELWPTLPADEQGDWFETLERDEARWFFVNLQAADQAALILRLPQGERALWVRLLAPDDAADVLQELEEESQRQELLKAMEDTTRREVIALLAYAEDDAGGLMSPRFARLRAEMSVDEAVAYLRRQASGLLETIYYAYVLDHQQHLLGVVSFRNLFAAKGHLLVSEVMSPTVISVPETMDQESVALVIARNDLMAVPVVAEDGTMRGIITVDDIVDVVQEEATEDIQKLGGMEALDTPYLHTGMLEMIKKRGVWLAVLFLGELLTTNAMGAFEHQIAGALVLAMFIPLIISSGGNSGSQAATLVIRAMALGEVRLRDWAKVVKREIFTGFALGLLLALLGLLRVVLGEALFGSFGSHYFLISIAVATSLIGVVCWGTFIGSMLPFIIRRVGADPASASAPFVATLVDVVGIIIYFSVANLVLSGSVL